MADGADIPQKAGPLIRWGIANLAWILPLVALEQLADEHYANALYFGIAAGIDISIGASLHIFTELMRRWRGKMSMIFVALGFGGALILGIAIGGLVLNAGPLNVSPAQATGRISWNFDQPGDNFFLLMTRTGNEELRIAGFQAHGKNTSADPITEFSGYMRSDLTNEERPIFIRAQDLADTNRPAFMPVEMIPTPPYQTYGIPGLSEFDIITDENTYIHVGVGGEPASEFLRDFGPFTIVLKYDGLTITRHFTVDQIKAQMDLLLKHAPGVNNVPRVTRKPTAPPAKGMPPLLPTTPKPSLAPPSPSIQPPSNQPE